MTGNKDRRLLLAIAFFKLLKGLSLIALAIAFLTFVHPAPPSQPSAPQTVAATAAAASSDDPDDPEDEPAAVNAPAVGPIRSPLKITERLMDRARHLSSGQRHALITLTFLYAILYLIEATGLFLRKRWAEWMVVIMTALFIPLEVYELFHKLTWVRPTVLLINVLVLAYLIHHLRQSRIHKSQG